MKKFMICPLKFFIALVTSLFSLALSITMLTLSYFFPSLVFFIIFVLFAISAAYSGSHIVISDEGVSRIGLAKKTMKWEEIEEIGVAGTKVLARFNKDKTGTLYIYFSPKTLSEKERFDMMLRWPPKNALYLEYTEVSATEVLKRWHPRSLVEYNTGDREILRWS